MTRRLSRPLAIDLFCGLGGWTEGLLAEGWDVVGFDIERHQYGEHRYPADLVIQDVLTLHGSQFRDAALIVASPPCQAYSYRAMPWKRAKALPPPDNTLFEACFRIQREACEAAARHIPLIVENVRGAQTWVGRARWNYGSFYLWGDVPALMPTNRTWTGENIKGVGPSWTAVQSRKTSSHWTNPAERRDDPGRKHGGDWFRDPTCPTRQGGQKGRKYDDGVKHHGSGEVWFDTGPASLPSASSRRKQASAMIAKIPLPLSRHIAAVYRDA
jgi:hypothetical protein